MNQHMKEISLLTTITRESFVEYVRDHITEFFSLYTVFLFNLCVLTSNMFNLDTATTGASYFATWGSAAYVAIRLVLLVHPRVQRFYRNKVRNKNLIEKK